ncbi:RNA-guided endonuclease InsQ/TnpB family protein [Nonomuraea montanisoli]|uniref:RNA-guided endonuclease InsQ/TnpB family protein n=1 Tax=Nonomuraea montanisoli TaxID=2741721 RepID=UPI002E288EA8|nr:transposase [Nonomuraea montanisoli]
MSFLVEDGRSTPPAHPGPAVGIDRGIKVAVTTSDGHFYDRTFLTSGEAKRCRRSQQRLARAESGSERRKRAKNALMIVMRRVRARRTDFNAQTAHVLTLGYGTIVLEDLRVRRMTASAKGDLDRPGTRVAQKSGLNRAVLDKSWYGLELALISAARYSGTHIVKVPAAYTSQKCSACGNVDPAARESQARYRCTSCHTVMRADVNAAINIKNAAGLAVSGRGDFGSAQSVKRQPPLPSTGLNSSSTTRGILVP